MRAGEMEASSRPNSHRFNSTVLLLALLAMIWFAFSLNLMTLHMGY
jgi:hypothetical protein